MAFDVVVPRHRWSRAALLFDRWLMDDGDWIKRGNAVCSLDVDGVSLQVIAEHDGFLTIAAKGLVAGEDVRPGTVLGVVTRPSESPRVSAVEPETVVLPPRRPLSTEGSVWRRQWPPPVKGRAASPRARRAARDAGVPLRAVRGTGPGGRITERDVRSAAPAIAATGGATIPAWLATEIEVSGDYRVACCDLFSQLCDRLRQNGVELSDDWEVGKLVGVERLRAGTSDRYMPLQANDSGARDFGDEVHVNMVPVYLTTESQATLLIPPLPPGALFAVGFSAMLDRPVVRDGRLQVTSIVTMAIAFDNQRLTIREVAQWL